jgi:hypothetical protein
MSLALKGYDLSSTEGLVAALTATLHPVTTERARMVPTIMAGIRRLGLDPAQEVAALITLQDALDQVGTGIIAARDLAKLSQELQSAATTPIRQLAQLDVDVDLQAPLFICADGTTAASADGCVLNQNNQERGSESYSG